MNSHRTIVRIVEAGDSLFKAKFSIIPVILFSKGSFDKWVCTQQGLVFFLQSFQLFRSIKGEASLKESVDSTKDGSICTNTNRQRYNCYVDISRHGNSFADAIPDVMKNSAR